MTTQISDGNTAFPIPGMTLRDYLAAHAPAEPQAWFEPVMPPRPRPVVDVRWHDRWVRREGWYDDGDDPGYIAYCRARAEYARQDEAWERERVRQLHIQWPWAWADAVLAGRKVREAE